MHACFCLSVTLLNGEVAVVCEHDIAIKPLEIGYDFDTTEKREAKVFAKSGPKYAYYFLNNSVRNDLILILAFRVKLITSLI